jgi:aquaporin Z
MHTEKYIAEFLGTFVFLSVIITTVDSHNIYITSQAWLKIGLALSVCILAFGFISGGHYNPAVSFMFYSNNQLSLEDLVGYIGGQLLGAYAAYVYYNMTKSYLK